MSKKLAAIYSVFDGLELLKGSIDRIKYHVDVIIIVYQNESNFGELSTRDDNDLLILSLRSIPLEKCELIIFTPKKVAGQSNEILKRQLGIDKAKELGCTHFISMDCDEYYEDFGKAKELYIESGAKGSVCKMWTYFKEPTLRLEKPEGYYVPFIHELNENTITGVSKYPFYCDRTRQINEENVVELPIMMHHFSWVRRDIEQKVRNSSARNNILRGSLLEDYHNSDLKEGFYVKNYEQKLIRTENIFNIPSFS